MTAAVDNMDTPSRLPRLRQALEPAGCDALVVSSMTNIRYLTGFTGSAGLLLVLADESVLVTDGRYGTQSVEQLAAAGVDARVEVAVAPAQKQAVIGEIQKARPERLGLEAAHLSWARQRSWATDWFAGLELVPTEGLVEALRRVKDAGELARIRRAAEIADQALANLKGRLAEGPTELEFGIALDFEMRRLGASGPAFETIVASGPNAAKPHHRPVDRPIGAGELVVLDFGATFDGYRSDMTRTYCVGEPKDAEMRRMVDVVMESQAAGVRAVRAGIEAADVDRTCRDVIQQAGWAEKFMHGTGHGVGLDIHEAPSVAPTSSDTLQSGHVVTVEPGVYLPGFAGVRIEDTLVVTDTGCHPLTSTPKDLSV
jgi:Xaa-Pro aminopeptidase